MRSLDRTDVEVERLGRLLAALVTVAIVAFGYLVLRPFSLTSALPWLFLSLGPPAIYYIGTTGLSRSIAFGALLLGITIVGWADVALAKEGDISGAYPIGVFVLTLLTSSVGATVSAAAERWHRS